jgi:lipopolysaccharide/colanic/teichoic acid biosynthesis glycosyltransferase
MINALKTKFYETKLDPDNKHLFIYDEKDFKKILNYERKRTDREGNCFSLIIIYSNENISRLITELNKRIRKIDLLGWFADNCLALLLPITSFSNAVQFYNDLLKDELFRNSINSTKIYTYPDHWNISNENLNIDNNLSDNFQLDSINKMYKLFNDQIITVDFKDEITTAFVSKIPAWKRFFDIIISFLSILAISPILILAFLYIKIISPGPSIFKQKRVGYKGKIFDFYKFRTMHINNNQKVHESYLTQLINTDKPMEKLDVIKDKRIIKGGGILRKACIDELPQLFNVLKGDMSLVGPRPCLPYEEKEYIHWFRNRFDILPGMTGLWQVSGKNKLSFKQMIRLDINYIKNLSLFLDIKIIILTIPTIINLILENKINKIKKIFKMT